MQFFVIMELHEKCMSSLFGQSGTSKNLKFDINPKFDLSQNADYIFELFLRYLNSKAK